MSDHETAPWPSFNIFQVAYVTDDIDMAVARAKATFGIGAFQINRSMEIQTGSGVAVAHFAIAFLGDAQIEIIQPAGKGDAVYRDGIRTPGGGLDLHHLGALYTDEAEWAAVLRAVDASGETVPVRGNFGGLMDYLYVDRRASLGHYLEYMYRTPAGAAIFDEVPRF